MDILTHWTQLFHVHLSPLYRHCYTKQHYLMFIDHWYTDTLFHWISSFPILVSTLYRYYVHSYTMFIYHWYIDSPVYMCWLFLYSSRMNHCSYYMENYYMYIHVFSLHDFSRYWYCDIITGYASYWYVMWGTKCHVDISHESHPRISHLLFPLSRYFVS